MRWYHWSLLVLFVLITVGVFAGAIGWPFWWKIVFKQIPPADISTFANLVTILLALLALGVGAFGALAYYLLRDFLKRDLREDIHAKFNRALSHSDSAVAYGLWRVWRKLHEDVALLDLVITSQRKALELLEDVKIDELPEKYRKAVYQAKSNLAGYIVCKHHCLGITVQKDEISLARKEGKEAYDKASKFGDEYDWKANYAAVLRAFGTESEKQTADKIISEIEERAKKEEIDDDQMKEYRELWNRQTR